MEGEGLDKEFMTLTVPYKNRNIISLIIETVSVCPAYTNTPTATANNSTHPLQVHQNMFQNTQSL